VRRHSAKRITLSTILLGALVFGIIAAVMLPRFIKLDTYRPQIEVQLREATGRRVTLGALRANLLPPSITAEKILKRVRFFAASSRSVRHRLNNRG
jgi:uncharacterized protein involved in outer membrane biogenesis